MRFERLILITTTGRELTPFECIAYLGFEREFNDITSKVDRSVETTCSQEHPRVTQPFPCITPKIRVGCHCGVRLSE